MTILDLLAEDYLPNHNPKFYELLMDDFEKGELACKNLIYDQPYCVDFPHASNATKYFFYMEVEMYYDEKFKKGIQLLQPVFDPDLKKKNTARYNCINVFLGDERFSDWNYDRLAKLNRHYYYHIIVDKRHPNFSQAIRSIQSSKAYVNQYALNSVTGNHIVLRVKAMAKNRVDKFARRDLPGLFAEKNYGIFETFPNIFLSYFVYNPVIKKYKLTAPAAVLLGIAKLPPTCKAEEIIEEFKIDDPDTIKVVYEQHGFPQVDLITEKTISYYE